MSTSAKTKSLTAERRLELLRDLAGIQSDADQQDPKASFLPLPTHDHALNREVLVVRGERGAGKTALFRFVEEMGRDNPTELVKLFPRAGLSDSHWIEGFSQSLKHPQEQAVDAFLERPDAKAITGFWMAHLVWSLCEHDDASAGAPLPDLYRAWRDSRNAVATWAVPAAASVAEFIDWLDRLDRRLGERGKTWFVTYDYLDRIGLDNAAARAAAVSSLLKLWTSFANRYRNLRGKIFLREDLFESAVRSFPDASKLAGRSVSLEWSVESLYRVLIRAMAARSDGLAEWIQEGMWQTPLDRHPVLGLLPPALEEQGRPSIKAFVDHLAGERMRSGTNKAFTYRWIPARLRDGHQRIVPRSIINLIGYAAKGAVRSSPRATHKRLLERSELEAALGETSKYRVAELAEEYPFVQWIETLRGSQLPMPQRTVVQRLTDEAARSCLAAKRDGADVLVDLLRLGVVTQREDGRIDIPDLYRYGFGLKRKGGAGRAVG